jgi:Tfp pilus assembly protein PilN
MEYSKEEAEKLKCEYGIPHDPKLLSMMRPVLEKLSSYVRDSLEYYGRQFKSGPVTKIILAGNGSRLKGLKEYLTKESGVEVIHVLPEHALAMGLALSKDNSLNMLPEVFKEEDKKKLKMISVRMLSFIIGLIVLFSYGFLCIKAHNLKKEIEIYQKQWSTIKEIKILRDKMLVCNLAVDTVSRNSLHIGVIMRELTNVVMRGLILDSVTIKAKELQLRLKGIVLNTDQLSEFMSNLENSPLFENVRLMFRKKSEKYSGDAVEFEITCKVVK